MRLQKPLRCKEASEGLEEKGAARSGKREVMFESKGAQGVFRERTAFVTRTHRSHVFFCTLAEVMLSALSHRQRCRGEASLGRLETYDRASPSGFR